MNTLKLIWLTSAQHFRKICQLPQDIVKAVKQRRRQTDLDKLEAERVDRICNPVKYRGK